ncbi:MAG: CpXC domain-containing protein [Nitrosopumilus sp.]|nr:CpXC domain-containing protein [Nitrosopumilus sp.]
MTLVVKCKSCSTVHKSPIQSVATKNEFIKAKEKLELFENIWKCPKCGRMSMYSSFDYGWQEEIKVHN